MFEHPQNATVRNKVEEREDFQVPFHVSDDFGQTRLILSVSVEPFLAVAVKVAMECVV